MSSKSILIVIAFSIITSHVHSLGLQSCSGLTKKLLNPIVEIHAENDSKSTNGEFITFKSEDNLEFKIQCNHFRAVTWIFDHDPVLTEFETKGSDISRSFTNFTDPSTYRFTTEFEIRLATFTEPRKFFICQSIESPCERTIVRIKSSHDNSKSIVIVDEDELDSEEIQDLSEVTNSDETTGSYSGSFNDKPCQLILYWQELNSTVFLNWTDPHNPLDDVNFDVLLVTGPGDAVALFRNVPLLEHHCRIRLHDDTMQNILIGEYKSLPLNSVGGRLPMVIYGQANLTVRRVVRAVFTVAKEHDKQHHLQFELKDLPAQDFLYIEELPEEVHVGTTLTITCQPSVYYFSRGTVVAVGSESRTPNIFMKTTEILDVIEEYTNYGTKRAFVDFTFRHFSNNNVTEIQEVQCFAPVWNSNEKWAKKSRLIRVKPSEPPKLDRIDTIYEFNEDEANVTVNCTATGIPIPEIDLIPPRTDIEFETVYQDDTEQNVRILIVTFPSLKAFFAGEYKCRAETIATGAYDEIKFFVAVNRNGGMPFELSLGLGFGLFVLLAIIALVLIFKIFREKADFRRQTDLIIKQFRDGQKDSVTRNDPCLVSIDQLPYNSSHEVPYYKWRMDGTLLGEGAFGHVMKGTVVVSNERKAVAIKRVKSGTGVDEFKASLTELKIMAYLGYHPNILNLLAACTDNIKSRSILIGFEICANGDLLNFLQTRRNDFVNLVADGEIMTKLNESKRNSDTYVNRESFNTATLYQWAFEIGNGMDFLGEKKILHGDLAARNVLLTGELQAKISDFGMSRELFESSNYTKKTQCPLPWRWMAIESLLYMQFSTQSDIWSYGITLWEIFSLGQVPYPNSIWSTEFCTDLQNGTRLQIPEYATTMMYKLMLKCWNAEPNLRPHFETIKTMLQDGGKDFNDLMTSDSDYKNIVRLQISSFSRESANPYVAMR